MAEIFPFAAYRYNPGKVRVEQAVTQPYDKITPEMQQRYYAASPFNLIPVEKGATFPTDTPENNVYPRAAAKLQDWIVEGALIRDPTPAIYVYFQEFQVPGTPERRTRKGFIALGRVSDYADKQVFRHELTHSGPKADRLELLRHTRTHTGQLFMLYADPARRIDALLDSVARMPASVEVRDEYGVLHRVWPVAGPEVIAQVRHEMAEKPLVIADGHHRYETALAYRNECRASAGSVDPNAPHEMAMLTLVNAHSEGLTILPTHRLVFGLARFDFAAFRTALEPHFDWSSFAFHDHAEKQKAAARLRAELGRGRERRAMGVYAGGGAFHLLQLRRDATLEELLPHEAPAQRQLDVVLLHRFLLEQKLGITPEAVVHGQNLAYEREMGNAMEAVDSGRAQLCFLLNPVRVEQVMEIALAGDVMPQKSTDFYPKMLSGLTLYRLDA